MNPRREKHRSFNIWHLVVSLVLVCIGVVLTRNAWIDMFHIALLDEESSHVWLVPVAVIWLVWVRRARIRQCRPARSFLGPLLIGLGWCAWDRGYRHQIQSMFHLGAVMVAVGCLLTVVGKDILFRFMPCFLVLVFLIPVPARVRTPIAFRMQTATAQATQVALEVFDVRVERQGNTLWSNGEPIMVAEACNGMRMVFTLILVSYIFAYITPLKHSVRLLILCLSPLTAILCNVIRLVPTVWLYGQVGNMLWPFGVVTRKMAEDFHDVTGWVMLVLAFALLTSVVRVLRWAFIPVAPFTLAMT